MGFMGEYLNKFDEAGRISLPAKMRDELRSNHWGEILVCYYAVQTGCLRLLPKSMFMKMEADYLQNPPKDKKSAERYRFLFANAMDTEINSSGRISISQKHRNQAGLKDDCYIIGVSDQILLWNTSKWEAETARVMEELRQEDTDTGNEQAGYLLF